MTGEPLISVDEAARLTGLSVASVRRRCVAGIIPAKKVGRTWLIEATALPRRRPKGTIRGSTAHVDLAAALKHVTKQDLRRDVWAPDVLRFCDELQMRDEVVALAADKIEMVADPDSPVSVLVPKSPLFARLGTDLSLADRVAYQALVHDIEKVTDARLSPRAYASRLSEKYVGGRHNPGVASWLQWKRDARRALQECRGWMVETDITRYFDFIEHRKLMQLLAEERVGSEVLRPLQAMLRVWSPGTGRGLPQGPDASRPLANFYLIEVDEAIAAMPDVQYFRYMDDIRLVSPSRASATRALQLIGDLAYRLGLPLSTQKTKVRFFEENVSELEADDLRTSGDSYGGLEDEPEDSEEDDPSYLREVFADAVSTPGNLDARRAKYSLNRLYRTRSDVALDLVLKSIDDLGPVAPLVARYLAHWIEQSPVGESLGSYLNDAERNTSEYFAAWLLTAPLEHSLSPHHGVLSYARRTLTDKNASSFLRATAANVVVLSGRQRDATTVERIIANEFDPRMVRGCIVALHRAKSLRKDLQERVRKRQGFDATLTYLRGRETLPSPLFADRWVHVGFGR